MCSSDLQVLAAVPLHGLEAVLVAIELALESGMANGEHVLNVLARLQHPVQRAMQIDTALPSAPPADTHRYDRLREVHDVA